MSLRSFRLGFDWVTYQISPEIEGRDDEFLALFRGFSQTANTKYGVLFFGCPFDLLYDEGKGRRTIYFSYSGDAVFCLTMITHAERSKFVNYIFTFYGASFYVPDLSHILLAFTSKYLPYLSISRLDLALDCNVPVQELWDDQRTQFKKTKEYKNNGVLESFYFGQRKGNRKHFIRVYNKKADSETKQKFHLFLPYFGEETVTRIEVEMHVLTLKTLGIRPYSIVEYEKSKRDGEAAGLEFIERCFASLCMNDQGTYFYSLKELDFSAIERLTTAKYTGKAEAIIDTMAYAKQFISRGLRLKQMGIDPIALLQRHLTPLPTGLNYPPSTDLPF